MFAEYLFVPISLMSITKKYQVHSIVGLNIFYFGYGDVIFSRIAERTEFP